MNYADVKRNIWSNSVSNYVRTIIGMLVGLLTFRLLYQSFGSEQFGFWSLLWSVFGYGVLLDFGFGFAAQKAVAELTVRRDWEKLSRILSAIFFFYTGVAVFILLAVFVGAAQIIHFLQISPVHAEEFRRILILFFVGIGLAFPMGVFPEILRGQQRIRLANNLVSSALLIRLALIAAAVWLKWSFLSIMGIALFFALAPDVFSALFALRQMPEVRIRLSLVSVNTMRETLQFSVFAYLNTATNIVLGKSSQLILGATLSVNAVAIYQAGAKVAEVFGQFTRQVQDTLSPAAAHLQTTGDRIALRDLLVNSLRWSVLIATPLYLLCAFYLDGLLQLLTGDKIIARETYYVGQVLLAWFYTTILTHSVSKRLFMMCGHERRLLRLNVLEAVANVLLSVVLILLFRHVVAVAVGSLIPALYVGWFKLWPWMAREAGFGKWSLFRHAVLPSWIACAPMLIALLAFKFTMPDGLASPIVKMFAESAAAGLLGLAGIWWFGLSTSERSLFTQKFPRLRIILQRQPV